MRIAAAAQSEEAVAGFLRRFFPYGIAGFPGLYLDMSGYTANLPRPRIDFWPGVVQQSDLDHRVILDDGRIITISPPPVQALGGNRCRRTLTRTLISPRPNRDCLGMSCSL